MIRRIIRQQDIRDRRGSLAPAVVFALLVVGLALGLVFDRLWIDAARIELTVAAEAAALRAANALADDVRLREDHDAEQVVRNARAVAAEIAHENLVAGDPVQLDTAANGDVRFGRIVPDVTGRGVFLETNLRPTTAVVLARRLRSRGNPLGLFLRGLTGQPTADVTAFAEATIDGRVVGVRPFDGANVPAIPLAILEHDPTGQNPETWRNQVDRREGDDSFGFDEETGLVRQSGDGIPEIRLRDTTNGPNFHWIDIGNGLWDPLIARQIDSGLSVEQLSDADGALLFDRGPLQFAATAIVDGASLAALRENIGESRICFLATTRPRTETGGTQTVNIQRIAAVRVLHVGASAAGDIEIIVQPTIVCTRTAVLADDDLFWPPGSDSASVAAYVYKLHLTR